MIQTISRLVLVVSGAVVGYAVTRIVDWQAEIGLAPSYVILLFIILGAAIGFLLGGIIGRELTTTWRQIERRLAEKSVVDLILGTSGMMIGLLIAFFASQPLRWLDPSWLAISTSAVLYVIAVELCMSVAFTRRRDVLTLFPRLSDSGSEPSGAPDLILDTSAVIDGRFTAMHRLGVLERTPRLPRFVLAELQTLADSADDGRRARGRRGLDLLATLPPEDSVLIFEIDYPEIPDVDDKLVALALESGGHIVTVDYNLTKVARVRGASVINLNELATALKPGFLPGDRLMLKITKPGKEPDQGVGHLEDGTMVVVKAARDSVGRQIETEVTSVLQTSAGRMIFASRVSEALESIELAGEVS